MAVLHKTNLALWHKELQTVSGSIQRTLDRPDVALELRGPTGMAVQHAKNSLDLVIQGFGALAEMTKE